jgi:hypothetical protein
MGNSAHGMDILSMIGFAGNWFRSISTSPPSGDALPEQQRCAMSGNYFQ